MMHALPYTKENILVHLGMSSRLIARAGYFSCVSPSICYEAIFYHVKETIEPSVSWNRYNKRPSTPCTVYVLVYPKHHI